MPLSHDIQNHTHWRLLGRRYLPVRDFVNLCEAVGLYGCNEHELESYEQQNWILPAARLVMPERYALAYWTALLNNVDSFEVSDDLQPFHSLHHKIHFSVPQIGDPNILDLRHPFDKSWGMVEGLFPPASSQYQPWDEYFITLQDGFRHSIAEHYYHHWQIYQVFAVRKFQKRMYTDSGWFFLGEGSTDENLNQIYVLLEFVSQYQHLYHEHLLLLLERKTPDADGKTYLTSVEQTAMEQALHSYAQSIVGQMNLDEEEVYRRLRTMMCFHYSLHQAERVRLAQALEKDLWCTLEFIQVTFNTPSEQIVERAGRIGGYYQNYLELLFPNRRKVVRDKAKKILHSLSQVYNQCAPSYAMTDADLERLLDYVERTDLALFEYILVELNDAHFSRHSWQTAEAFLQLKSLASFPESFMKTVIMSGADAAIRTSYNGIGVPGMSRINKLLFQNRLPDVWREYDAAGNRSATNAADFQTALGNLSSHFSPVPPANENIYLGVTLSWATLLRNFTSHFLVENPQLLEGQYTLCVRAVIGATFLIWKFFQRQGWV